MSSKRYNETYTLQIAVTAVVNCLAIVVVVPLRPMVLLVVSLFVLIFHHLAQMRVVDVCLLGLLWTLCEEG